ncbi:MAG: hypothetical protein D8M59_14115 [Planctomycetes bacterium]|nr:hypothetical protein [Planctomycetota bacterium]NOG55467.1 hypothetical protein [Planctomycetota bacterium]
MQGLGRDAWLVVTYFLLLILGLFLLLTGYRAAGANIPGEHLVILGILCVVITASLIPVGVAQIRAGRAANAALKQCELLKKQIEILTQIHEHTMLSDSAKRIAYRRNEREMLRKAIEEDIAQEDWDAALVLVDDMSERFGYREEAEEFRHHIEQTRQHVVQQRIDEAISHFDTLVEKRVWSEAYAEAARLQRLFPDARRVVGLERRVRQAWEDHKHLLERRFLEVASRGESEPAMDILRELDQYLSEREAEPYREVARGVISQAKENLGLQFKMAVQDHDWQRAIQVGQRIVQEFPNTLMAREVRERIDMLRLRASGVAGLSESPENTEPDATA